MKAAVITGLACLVVSLTFPATALAATWYVNGENASGIEDGTSWATAFRTIQAGVAAASHASGGFVWVARGTYTADSSPVVTMADNVHIYGGFAGTEGPGEFDLRDPAVNITIIDGEGVRRCVVGADNARLDGFVITRGMATGTSTGGGMECRSVSPTIYGCKFVANDATYGAAMYFNLATVNIDHCQFFRNVADQSGAAIVANRITGAITNCMFVGNKGYINGGGIMVGSTSTLSIDDCVFATNDAWDEGGALLVESGPNVAVNRCHFIGNTCSDGSAIVNNDGVVTVASSVFIGNSGLYGAGVYTWDDGTLKLTNCTFRRNTAHYTGGALHIGYNRLTMTNCILWDNIPDETYFYSSIRTISHCDVKGGLSGTNMLDTDPLFRWAPSGLLSHMAFAQDQYQSTLTSSSGGLPPGELAGMAILIDHADPEEPPRAYLISDNTANTITVWGDATVGGNEAAPKAFEILDWHLRADSPCVDVGMNTSDAAYGAVTDDIEQEPRGYDGRGDGATGAPTVGDGSDYDMGADENTGGIDPEPQVDRPDLMIDSVTHSPLTPRQGETVTITVVVRNSGPGAAGQTVVTIALPGESTPPAFSVPALEPGATHSVERQVALAAGNGQTITVVVDPLATIAEVDETNNVGTDTIDVSPFHACDINRDGFVNAIDVQLCVNAILGISIGTMDADVNDDHNVNALDLQRVVNVVIGD